MANDNKLSDLAQDLNIEIEKEIGQGTSSIVYRARPKDLNKNELYAIKVQKSMTQPGSGQYFNKRFIKEASTLARMRHPGMVQLFAVKEYEDRICLVMEYFDGDPLTKVLSHGALSEEKTLKITKILTGALREAHVLGLAHRDIKPDNILINLQEQVKLIDFGFAAEHQSDSSTEQKEIVGTFNYSSPEQLGVLKRPVDQRSDLYSLGIILFECLTGHLPFDAVDVGELAHQHLSKEPAKVYDINPKVSLGISAVIAKLLKKDPDDRYQTCEGLLADLEDLSKINGIFETGQVAALGAKDGFLKNAQAGFFVGREPELRQLSRSWEDVIAGKGGVVFLEGEPGIGKSRLIREFIHLLPKTKDGNGPLILGAKAERGEALPFKLLKDLVDVYIRQMISLENLTLVQAKEKLVESMGEYVAVLRHFSPQVTRILSDVSLSDTGVYSQEIFQHAITEFLVKLAKRYGAAILLIDDSQWMDEGTHQVLKKLNLSTIDNRILLIITGRNDEESAQKVHALMSELDSVRKCSAQINLKALEGPAIKNLIQQYLRSEKVENKITEILTSRCHGNPFMCIEYLQAMLDAGVLSPQWNEWTLNQKRMDGLSLGADLIALVLTRLNSVKDETKDVLTWAAVIGGQFSVDFLAEVCPKSRSQIEMAVGEASQSNLIEKNEIGLSQFVHDRVREALLTDIGEGKKKEIHQKVAQVLNIKIKNQNLKGFVDEQTVYSLAHHSYMGSSAAHHEIIYASNYQAGQVAFRNYANEEAYQFLNRAQEVAIDYKIVADAEFYNLIGHVCMLTFRLKDSIGFFEQALQKTAEQMQRAKIKCLIAQAKLAGWEVSDAWNSVNDALAEIGRPLPAGTFGKIVSTLGYWPALGVLGYLKNIFRLKTNSNPKKRLLVDILNAASEIAVFKHPILLPVTSMRAVFHSTFLEDGPEKTVSLGMQSLFLKGFKMPGGNAYFARAMAMAQKLNNKTLMGTVTYLWGLAHSIIGDLNGFEKYSREALNNYGKWIIPRHFFDMAFSVAWVLQMRGKIDEAIIGAEALLMQSKSAKNSSAVYPYYSPAFYGALLAIKGRVREGTSYINTLKTFLQGRDPNPVLGGDVNAALVAAYLEQEDFGHELEETLKRIKVIAPNPMFSFFCMKNAYISLCYIRLNQVITELKNKGKNVVKAKEVLRSSLAELKKATQGAVFYQPHVLAIQASLMIFEGQFKGALSKLNKAEKIAQGADNDMALYEIFRIKARLFRVSERAGDSSVMAQQAHNLASAGLWINRLKWLEDEFGVKGPERAGSTGRASSVHMDSTKFGVESLELKRYLNSLLQVSLASSTVLDPQEQVKIALDEIIRVMGAERAYVFLWNETTGKLEFTGGRNDSKTDLASLEGYSSTIVNKVLDTKEPLVVTGSDEGQAMGSQSAVAYNLKSIMAVPMTLREDFKGIVYIDSKLAKGVFSKSDTGILTSISNHIAIAFETAKLTQIELAKKIMENDLEVGSSVQNLFFPKNPMKETKAISLFGLCRPAAQCGGDWWWYDTRKDGSTLVFLGDVTGHGAGPAMITASIAAHYLSLRKNNDMLGVPELIDSLSRQLHEFADGDYLMTGIMILIDESGKKMTLWSAGGPHVIILDKDGAAKYSSAIGSPMGVSGLTKTGQEEFSLNQGDRIVICSDGISETNLPNGRILGDRRIKQLLVEAQSMKPKEAMVDFITKIDKLRGALPQDDDYTIVMADIR